MSSDNFWYVKDTKVYMGDASQFAERVRAAEETAERRYKASLVKGHPYHEAATHVAAVTWAMNEYSEYGIYWIDGIYSIDDEDFDPLSAPKPEREGEG